MSSELGRSKEQYNTINCNNVDVSVVHNTQFSLYTIFIV